ncbi:hypothetical protein [Nonomuraea sp. GTA35]|uniref:hypothetical protein n=1 Tax=Nonomuraea sp. GTA35 TaxID=1676746 RepID=UPI0035C02BE2
MTVQAAFADAGAELRTGGTANEVALSEADKDEMWSVAELHAAMARHFSLHRDAPQWKLWTFIANRQAYDDGTPSKPTAPCSTATAPSSGRAWPPSTTS